MSLDKRLKTYTDHLNVSGFLQQARFPADYTDLLKSPDGRAMPPEKALAYFVIQRARDVASLPLGDCARPCPNAGKGCTGFDYKREGCPGYYTDADAPPSGRR